MDPLDIILPEKIVEITRDKGKSFAINIKTNQIRNFYSSINLIRQKHQERTRLENLGQDADADSIQRLSREIHSQIILLEPKLAYAAGRQSDVKPFYTWIVEVIEAYQKASDKKMAVENLIILIESVVAFHKFNNGN